MLSKVGTCMLCTSCPSFGKTQFSCEGVALPAGAVGVHARDSFLFLRNSYARSDVSCTCRILDSFEDLLCVCSKFPVRSKFLFSGPPKCVCTDSAFGAVKFLSLSVFEVHVYGRRTLCCLSAHTSVSVSETVFKSPGYLIQDHS
ncbi:hypothetical protein PoB_003726600 [Plakobranchus ocellatus]|uniref:Secreted protein n=1 Tax=Plakobranchus ocellatus TaxID=259542 RepID=A0AAV4ARI1_9GAST|nr:hypothetical protein PoB_003726600 [Plakobranchus ocellatus]